MSSLLSRLHTSLFSFERSFITLLLRRNIIMCIKAGC
jgi:hypothetical protein